jgi:hypothetical protein
VDERLIAFGREMLRDQINLIKLLNQELPAISSRAEAFVNLAFDVCPQLPLSLRLSYPKVDAGIQKQ